MVVRGGGAVSYERGTPVLSLRTIGPCTSVYVRDEGLGCVAEPQRTPKPETRPVNSPVIPPVTCPPTLAVGAIRDFYIFLKEDF